MIALETLSPPTSGKAWRAITGHTLTSAAAIHGGLSTTSKMPSDSYGLPAAECNVGGALQSVPDSVCFGCYALKGRYAFANVQEAQYRRLASVVEALNHGSAREDWLRAIVASIGWRSRNSRVFRWHDSGDIQSLAHLELIADVADALPWVRFWIPTRERAIVREFVDYAPLPANLTVRMSAALVGHFPKLVDGYQHSAVARKGSPIPDGAQACPARFQDGECGDCRACWSPDVPLVVYPLH